MSKLDEFLEDLDNSELSVFAAYRFEGFLDESRQKIKNEILKRELSKEKLIELYQKGTSYR